MAYSSKYYDPRKAHEYYMANRQLKGRRSTAGLNESGKAAASYVRSRLNDEYKRKSVEINMKRDAERKALRDKTNVTIERMRAQIKEFREMLKTANKLIKDNPQLAKMQDAIKALRAQTSAASKDITRKYSEMRRGLKAGIDERYMQELEKIKNDQNKRNANSSVWRR